MSTCVYNTRSLWYIARNNSTAAYFHARRITIVKCKMESTEKKIDYLHLLSNFSALINRCKV